MSNWKEHSKTEWCTGDGIGYPGHEQIKLGCLQRIATATEVMAKNYSDLINERDRYQSWYHQRGKEMDRLNRRVAALRGVISRLKKGRK